MSFQDYFIASCIINGTNPKIILASRSGNIYKIDKINENLSINIKDKDLKKLFKISGRIRLVQSLDNSSILIGLWSGEIFKYSFNTQKIELVRNKSGFGLWRLLVLDFDKFVITGKYGYMACYYKDNGEWKNKRIQGNRDSIFCLNYISTEEFITVDYYGVCKIWKYFGNDFKSIKMNSNMYGNMQYAIPLGSNEVAMINRNGNLYIFTREGNELKKDSEYATTWGEGTGILSFNNFLVGGTEREIIKINLDDNRIEKAKLQCISLLSTIDNESFVGTPKNFSNLKKIAFTPYQNIKSTKYAKVGIVGLTGTGKSTICNRLKTGGYEPKLSTLGRKIWPFKEINGKMLPENCEIKILDVAGQESQLFTFFPRFWDSKIILACYRKTSSRDLILILEAIKLLKKFTPSDCQYYLLQTWTDSPNSDVEGFDIKKKCEELKIENIPEQIEISSKDGIGFDKLYGTLNSKIKWDEIRSTTESELLIQIRKFIEQQRETKIVRWLKVDRLIDEMKKLGLETPRRHIKFILENLDEQGEIDFISSIQLIIINDDIYNKLWSKIPTIIKNSGGIIKYKNLVQKLKNSVDLKENLERLEDANESNYFYKYIIDVIQKFIDYEHALIYHRYEKEKLIIMPGALKDKHNIPEKYQKQPYKPIFYCSTENLQFPWYKILRRIRILEDKFGFKLEIVDISNNLILISINNDDVWFTIDCRIETIGLGKEILNIKYYFNGKKDPAQRTIKKLILNYLSDSINCINLNPNNSINNESTSKLISDTYPNKKSEIKSFKDNYQKKNKTKSILLIGTCPDDDNSGIECIRYDREFREIKNELKSQKDPHYKIIDIVLASRIDDLFNSLLEEEINILHISTHGFPKGIILEDDDGLPIELDGNALSNLLVQFKESIQCIILNCCDSEEIASNLSDLIPYTIGMSDLISDESAIIFAKNFYKSLAHNKSIEESFNLAQTALQLKGLLNHNVPKLFKMNGI